MASACCAALGLRRYKHIFLHCIASILSLLSCPALPALHSVFSCPALAFLFCSRPHKRNSLGSAARASWLNHLARCCIAAVPSPASVTRGFGHFGAWLAVAGRFFWKPACLACWVAAVLTSVTRLDRPHELRGLTTQLAAVSPRYPLPQA